MRVLLDTHAFLWWVSDSRRLSTAAYRAIDNQTNEIVISAASAWEIATKHRLGKLPEAESIATDIADCIADEGFEALSISVADAERSGRLPGLHGDPFDRLLVAQALRHDLAIVSADAQFDRYGVNRLW
ncbi:MAG: type II toxin-antitoxin system VapC family toxin [Rhodospirillales bacterium]|nr:type II toxin-antitoxin system VapC family toxin [Rhodospirillales bacterium]MDE0380288.1 type II toxin-antitoxin system VapC family toxin [Rhodospirillales bacterium]